MRIGIVLMGCVVLSANGCAQGGAPSQAPSQARALAMPSRAVAPAGRIFDARLETNLDSQSAEPGDPVHAQLDEPLLSSDGAAIAPRGTPLIGRVLSVGKQGVSRITLQFDGLLLGGRVYPIESRVRWAESAQVTHPEPASLGSTVANLYPDVEPSGPMARGVGGGPPPANVPLMLKRGTKIQLVLERPFRIAEPVGAEGEE